MLNALGGKRKVVGLWCEKCNNQLGGSVDSPLVRTLVPFSVLLGCKRGDGDPVEPWKDARTHDGELVTVLPGGRPVAPLRDPMPAPVKLPDGRTQVRVAARDAEEVAYYLAHQVRRLGVGGEAVHSVESVEVSTWAPAVTANTEVGGHEWGRAVAKMALAAIVRVHGRSTVDQPTMEPLIRYVLTGDGASKEWPEMAPGLASCSLARRFAKARVGQHVLAVYESAAGQSEALFMAFGCIAYRIRLAPVRIGLHGAIVHVVDPIAGWHKVSEFPGTPPLEGLNKETFSERHARAAMDELMALIEVVQTRQVISEEAAAAWEMFSGREDGSALTPEDGRAYALEVLRRVEARGRRDETTSPLNGEAILARARELLGSLESASRRRRRKNDESA